MSTILYGADVAKAINERSVQGIAHCQQKGVTPTLAILRVGQREDDLSYERGVTKRCESLGVQIKKVVLDEKVDKEEFYQELQFLNEDDQVHGILMFRPLPKYLDNEKARKMLDPKKDVDGCTDGSLAGVFTNTPIGFAPCTAQAAIEILDYYHIDIAGKNVVVLGRSLVVGKPVSMLLLNRNATVTVCHTKTVNTKEITKNADIIIAATGQMESLNASYFSENQTVIDVGISWNDQKQKLCGDVLFDEVSEIVSNITPVPRGVGSVTTSILVNHVVEACIRKIG